jgi:hypothetical protein
MILLSSDIYENENTTDYISSAFEAILYRIITQKVQLIRFDEFRIFILFIKRFEIIKYS